VTINCAERGLLLLRVRDEIRMSIAAYQTLYESSIAFGMRKALMAEQKKTEMENTINTLTTDNGDLERQVDELTNRIDVIQKKEAERRKADEAAFAEEVENLKKMNENFKASLESMLSAPKK